MERVSCQQFWQRTSGYEGAQAVIRLSERDAVGTIDTFLDYARPEGFRIIRVKDFVGEFSLATGHLWASTRGTC